MLFSRSAFLTFLIFSQGLLCAQGMADHFVTTWNTTNNGASNSTSIIIPTDPDIDTYDYDVDWDNDGTFDEIGITGDIEHTFGEPGTYTIRVRGAFPHIIFDNSGDKQKLLSIDQWGTISWSSMESAFEGCSNVICLATDSPDLSGVTDMNSMFRNASQFTGDLSAWDVSTVNDMGRMFSGTPLFNSDLSAWDVSSAESLMFMFRDAESFNSDLSQWDVGNVENMLGTFKGTSSFTSELNDWDVQNVTAMDQMFHEATIFNSPLDQWDVGDVQDMRRMFDDAFAFDQDLSTWDVSNVADMTYMFWLTGLSTENYDALLIGWADNPSGLQESVGIHAPEINYCEGEEARQFIINLYGWLIFDDGLDCLGCPSDINSDSVVNVDDFIDFNSAYGDDCDSCPEDINEDGVVDTEDFIILNSNVGTICD